MTMKHVLRLTASLLFLCAAAPAAAEEEGCQLTRVAQLDMSVDATGRINVPMQISGQTLNLLIDTGGVNSMLSQPAVDALGLHPEIFDSVRVGGFGGLRIKRYVTAHDVSFGGLRAHSMQFLVMPEGRLSPDIQGLLGPDILRAYDDDFDFANAKFSLFQQAHCGGNLVWWTNAEHSEIPFSVDEGGHIQFYVELDGKKVKVWLDTGASGSIMSLEEAESLFGFDEKEPSLKPLRETANGHTYKYPFKMMTFGGVTVSNPDLVLISRDDTKMYGIAPILLGIGILRQLHMYISYREKKIFVTAATAH